MDSLVAQYTRPAHTEEGQSYDEQQELAQATPELSLKFALPPVAQVCPSILDSGRFSALQSILY